MSRIGLTPISIPDQVKISHDQGIITVTGPKGELSHSLPPKISLTQTDDQLRFSRQADTKEVRALHGLTRALVANMVTGVSTGYQKHLELIGTGYRVVKQGDKLVFNLGFSHQIEVPTPQGVTFEIEGNTKITVTGIDKRLVGQTAADIRALKKPEPYKGKGIRYQDEVVRRKAGKAAKVGSAGGGD